MIHSSPRYVSEPHAERYSQQGCAVYQDPEGCKPPTAVLTHACYAVLCPLPTPPVVEHHGFHHTLQFLHTPRSIATNIPILIRASLVWGVGRSALVSLTVISTPNLPDCSLSLAVSGFRFPCRPRCGDI